MDQPGYVYILVNPSANEFLKIGKTERDPEARAKELSAATGVPTPFYVAFQSYFQDCTRAEEFVHARLEKHRVASNREFFRLPLRQAIEAILEAERVLGKTTHTSGAEDDSHLNKLGVDHDEPWKVFYESADNHYFGHGDALQDYDEALKLYKQAARLGCMHAFWTIGRMYRSGQGCIADDRMALDYFKEGTQNGDDRCWAEMAEIFFGEQRLENAEKCWMRYFASRYFLENITHGNTVLSRAYYGMRYVQEVFDSERPFTHRDKIIQVKDEIKALYQALLDNAINRGNGKMELIYKSDMAQFEWRVSDNARNR